MSFNVYYKIKDNLLTYVGLEKVNNAKIVSFDSYEDAIIFEDILLRWKYNYERVNDKKIKKLSKEVNG